jgi:hypothetical protein
MADTLKKALWGVLVSIFGLFLVGIFVLYLDPPHISSPLLQPFHHEITTRARFYLGRYVQHLYLSSFARGLISRM